MNNFSKLVNLYNRNLKCRREGKRLITSITLLGRSVGFLFFLILPKGAVIITFDWCIH